MNMQQKRHRLLNMKQMPPGRPLELPPLNWTPHDHLDVLWHLDCVVSPRSPISTLAFSSASCSPSRFTTRSLGTSPIHGHRTQRHVTVGIRTRRSMTSVFRAFDENGDGRVSAAELGRMYEKLGIPYTSIDGNCVAHDDVNEEEFLHLFMSHIINEKMLFDGQSINDEGLSDGYFADNGHPLHEASSDTEKEGSEEQQADDQAGKQLALLRVAFQVFDKNRDGYIEPVELQRVLRSLGFEEASDLASCARMIERFDLNNDGRIDFMEFATMLAGATDDGSY